MAIAGLFGNAILNDTTEHAIEQIVKYGPLIIARAFFNIGKTLSRIQSTAYEQNIKELFLDKTITYKEKVELLRVKIKYALKNLNGKRSAQFLRTIIS